jgi:hypothetical protein
MRKDWRMMDLEAEAGMGGDRERGSMDQRLCGMESQTAAVLGSIQSDRW